ncbi:MAG TPA: ATP-binding protein [Chloroflexaceae bacterium]|nr:ATP-binding protein [Chloroflexaceae bacterium]
MARWFNVAGPCRPDIHYMLPATERLPDVMRLISQQSYFVLHAPRQTGKTTAMLSLAQELMAGSQYLAALVSVEAGAPFGDDIEGAELAILGAWQSALRSRLPATLQPPSWPDATPGARLREALRAWAAVASRPLVLFLDEIDALQGAALLSVLRQLRDGFADRPQGAPSALALIGLRDVRDYKVASGGSERLTTASPFNIKVESLTLRDFTPAEVADLYAQHTADTGQGFTPAALARAFELTQGQPWLVNALARQAVEVIAPDPAVPIDVAQVDAARDRLIQRQDTHLDSLAERLREPRVRAVIEPLLAGTVPGELPADDVQFVQDLGLVRMDPQAGLVIANPIYAAVIPRTLTTTTRAFLPATTPVWLTPEGVLDPERLREAFLGFWRRHGQPLLGTTAYHEIAPHLVLMAFLDRVANGGGRVERESAVGRGRLDLRLEYGDVVLPMEVKVWRDGEGDPRDEGLTQLEGYLQGLGVATGWLVIFDQRRGRPPIAERTTTEATTTPGGYQVTVIRA